MTKLNIMLDEEKWYQTITFKMLLIGLLVLLLLIPLGMVKSVIREREVTDEEVELEIMEQWGGPQVVSGPTMHVPVFYNVKDKDDKVSKVKKWLHVMPEELDINGTIETELRKRGIYETPVYNAILNISGLFSNLHKIVNEADEIDWKVLMLLWQLLTIEVLKARWIFLGMAKHVNLRLD